MTKFMEMGLSQEVLKGIEDLGFVEPTAVQAKTIPFLLETKRDLVALAQTGTGKTAAFGLPLIQKLTFSSNNPEVLVLCPTRELCLQITKDMQNYAKYLPKVSTVPVYGGANIDTQIRAIKKGANIIVATPGRMLDIIRRRKIDLSEIEYVVLDEADEMLNMGFLDDINEILEETPDTKSTLLYSATMPKEVANIAMKYMSDPYEITVGKKNAGAENVEHIYYTVQARDRYLALKRIADLNPDIYGIVFCRTRMEAKQVAEKFMQDGYNADALHGDLSQSQRDYVMGRFRTKSLQMLIATDVAARGIDVDDLTHVINYNLPEDIESYTHRSGRTGRAGKSGTSIAIINMREKGKIRRIEKMINKSFIAGKIPTGEEICEKQLFHLVEKMQKVEINEDLIAPYMEAINEKFTDYDKEAILKRFVYTEFERFINYYKNASEIDASSKGGREDFEDRSEGRERGRGKRRNPGGEPGFSRFFINIGRKDGLNPRDLIGVINDNTNDRDIEIGAIDIMGTFSFFEVPEKSATKILNSFQGAEYNGRDVRVEQASASNSPEEGSEGARRRSSGGDRRSGDRRSSGGDRRSSGGDRRSGGDDRRFSSSRRSSSGGDRYSGGDDRRSRDRGSRPRK